MKKLIIFLAVFFLFGCSHQVKNKIHKYDLIEHFYNAYMYDHKNMTTDEIDFSVLTGISPLEASFSSRAFRDGYTNTEIIGFVNKNLPPYLIEVKDCEKEIKSFRVLQTLIDEDGEIYGSLAQATVGPIVFLPINFRQSNKKEMIYDDLKITLKKTDCVVFPKTFTYLTKDDNKKTVPEAIVIDRINPKFKEAVSRIIESFLEKQKNQ